jgi:iron complex outermembrane receptor protein
VSRDADAESATSLFGSVGRGRFTLQGAVVHRRKEVPTGSYETTLDDRNYTDDDRGWIDGLVTGSFKGAALSGRGFADFSRYRGYYVYADGELTSIDAGNGAWVGFEGTASRSVAPRHHVTTGVEYRRNLWQDQSSIEVDPVVVNLDTRYRSSQAAIYAQDEIALHRRLTATVGGRYDWWSLTGGTATPRAGLVYRTHADTAIKALYGEAYRAPTVYETYYYPDDARVLRPERLRTSEVVYEQYIGGTLRLTATGYVTRARNLISQRADYVFENREQARSHGVEVEAERRFTSGLLLRGSFVAQQTRDPIADVELSNSPRRLALLQAALPLWQRRVAVAAESQYVGARFSTLGTPIDGVWLTHVNVNVTPPRRALSVAARVSNLFDTAYAHPVGVEFRQDVIPQDGRSVSVRATLRF